MLSAGVGISLPRPFTLVISPKSFSFHTTAAAVQAVADRGATVAADGEEYGVRTQGDKCEWSTQVATDSGKDATIEEVKKLGLTFVQCRYCKSIFEK
eukprot:COSAG03_NODE_7525_length_905_cov_1.643921_2_plen_96_part_01